MKTKELARLLIESHSTGNPVRVSCPKGRTGTVCFLGFWRSTGWSFLKTPNLALPEGAYSITKVSFDANVGLSRIDVSDLSLVE